MAKKEQPFAVKNQPQAKNPPASPHSPRRQKPRYGLIALFLFISIGGAVAVSLMNRPPKTQDLICEVVREYPHDPKAFTQGLLFVDGELYESTGLDQDDPTSRSVVRIVDLETGETKQETELPDKMFGEGLALLNDKLYQLTWKDKKLFVYNKQLERIAEHDFPHEGWGLTTDGKSLIMSDGQAMLQFFDPDSLKRRGAVEVRYRNYRQHNLNELEYVNGYVYANVWQSEHILKIDPNTGIVVAKINMAGLYQYDRKAALNGIAYDETTDRWFVTGKLWNKLFEVNFVEQTK